MGNDKEIYRVATSSKMGDGVNAIGEKSKVAEDMFWSILNKEVETITRAKPDKFDDTFKKAKEFLELGNSLTVGGTWFKISSF